MGRTPLPLACSHCKRTPDQVKIYTNRLCVDCMREYNRSRHAIIKGQQPNYDRASKTQTLNQASLILSEDGNYVYTEDHWEEYDPNDVVTNNWLWKEAEERQRKGTHESDVRLAERAWGG